MVVSLGVFFTKSGKFDGNRSLLSRHAVVCGKLFSTIKNVLILYLGLMYNFYIMAGIFERSWGIRLQCNLPETMGACKVGE